MSRQTGLRLRIVEAPPTTRRLLAENSAKKSDTKRAHPASAGKSVKKRDAGTKTRVPSKAKARSVARPRTSPVTKSKPVQRRPKVQVVESVLPIEIDLPCYDSERVEPPSDILIEKLPAVLEPPFVETTVVGEVFAVESEIQPELQAFTQPETPAELEAIPEPELNVALQTIAADDEMPRESVLLATPENIQRPFTFQWSTFLQLLARSWDWLHQRLKTQQAKKRLRVCETVSLGEKRFIAVVQVDGEQFLVGGSSSSVSTLAHLEPPRQFSEVFRRYGQSGMQA